MSRFLSLKCDPISPPATADPVDGSTWCALRIQVGSRVASRLWDKRLQDGRDYIDVPAFPVAEWLVKNWWSLFHELCPGNGVPRNTSRSPSWQRWARRHCLRAADSSLLLPRLFIYTDGPNLLAESHADRPGSLPNMPGEFVHDGLSVIDRAESEDALVAFVQQTIDRVEGLDSDRVKRAAGQWHAIQNAEPDEVEFCKLAGRMGLDPYDAEETTDDLARFFEHLIAGAEDPLVRDLTEVARPETVRTQWAWVNDESRSLHLGPRSARLPFELPLRPSSPAEHGYELARRFRSLATAPDAPIESVEETASAVTGRHFEVLDRNHLSGNEIKAIVGESDSGDFVVAGPRPHSPQSRRFTCARGLFHLLSTSQASQRLVTRAYSQDQKASRAFAAEFLAPQRVLLDRLEGKSADPETVEELAHEFQVSNLVIQWQLENAGVPLTSD